MEKEKHIKIQIPEGYEIDKEKSSFEKIVFKKKLNGLPNTWEELEVIKGFYVNIESSVDYEEDTTFDTRSDNKNVFPSKEEAEASIALAQLCQLRDRYNTDENGNVWKPDWKSAIVKDVIVIVDEEVKVATSYNTRYVLVFKSLFICDHFAKTFKDLILEAKSLL